MPYLDETPGKNVQMSYNFNSTSSLSTNFHEDEQKRLTKWLNFTKNNISLGFDNLGTSYLPVMTNEKRGFVLNFEKIIGWKIQQKILLNLLKKNEATAALNTTGDVKSQKIIKDSDVYNNYEFKFSLCKFLWILSLFFALSLRFALSLSLSPLCFFSLMFSFFFF